MAPKHLIYMIVVGVFGSFSESAVPQITVSGGSKPSIVVSGVSLEKNAGSSLAGSPELIRGGKRVPDIPEVPEIFSEVPDRLPEAPEPEAKAVLPSGWRIDFWSDVGCIHCIRFEQSEAPKLGSSVRKLNWSQNRNHASRLGIRSLPTFQIVDPNNAVRYTYIGFISADTLIHQTERLSAIQRSSSQRLVPTQIIPNQIRYWKGIPYNPQNYRRCGDPNCPMCNWIMGGVEQPETNYEMALRETPDDVLTRMLKALNLEAGTIHADIGCGNGKILIEAVRDYGVFGIGVEIDSNQVALARQRVREAGLEDRIKIIEGDAKHFDPERYGVTSMTAYLYQETLDELSNVLNKSEKLATPFHRPSDIEMEHHDDFWLKS